MDFRELFKRAAQASSDLERCRVRLAAIREKLESPGGVAYDSIHVRNGSVSDHTAPIDSMIEKEAELRQRVARECEQVLGVAWEAVGIVSADLSDADAQVLSQHYLFGDPWGVVAQSIGKRSRTTPMDMANAALDWLDSFCEISEDEDGPHIHVIKE